MGEAGKEGLADEVFEALVRFVWGARQHSQTLLRQHGVTAAQLTCLRVLERRGPQTHADLARALLLGRSTVSGLLERLETRGLIERRRSPSDRRRVEVSLGEAGRSLLGEIPRGQSKFGKIRHLIEELPSDEARGFRDTLFKLVDLMSREGLLDEGDLSDSPGEL